MSKFNRAVSERLFSLIPIAGADGKLHADDLARGIRTVAESKRTAVPACVSITNATEAGTVYSAAELRNLADRPCPPRHPRPAP